MSVLGDVAAAAGPALAGHVELAEEGLRFGPELGERLFVFEAVYEGYLLHYGGSRIFGGMDEDLRLLAGDALFALGLARLAERGDLVAVNELSALISRSAQAHAEGRGDEAEALWDDSASALTAA